MKSVRFFPHWRETEISQVVGLLELVNAVLQGVERVDRWIEVGSYVGESATLLAGFPQIGELHLVELSKLHATALVDKFKAEGRVTVHNVSSIDAAKSLPMADVVYIDADHSFDAVCRDIEAWRPRVRAGGYLCGHDYCEAWPGVVRAVDGLLGRPRTFRDGSWMVRV